MNFFISFAPCVYSHLLMFCLLVS